MRIGPLELFVRKQADNSWRYDIVNVKTQEVVHHGFRPRENEAHSAGFDDAQLIRAYQ